MECLCGQAAGFHEDQTHNESPVVISSYASQLELDCMGRHTPLYVLCTIYDAKVKIDMDIKRQSYLNLLFFST